MEKKYHVKWLWSAKKDINEIQYYIAYKLKFPQVSINILTQILLKLNSIERFPYLYPQLNTNRIKFKNLRKFCVSNYLVFYKVNQSKNLILIYRIIYSRRNYSKLL